MDELPAIGLIFLYRRNRRAVLDPTEDVHGIRLNIPLSRIAATSKSQCLSFAWMVSITIGTDLPTSNGAAGAPLVEIDSSNDGTLSEVTSHDSEAEPYVVQFGVIRKDPVWDDFMSYVEKAKAATAADATEWIGSNVYIDFDPRADFEDDESEGNGLSVLQKSVSLALGLDPTKEFYSEWRYPCLRHESKEHTSVGTAHTHRRIITHHGYFAVNAECIGFWSRSITFHKDVCYRIPIARVRGIKGQERCRFSKEHTLVIEVQGRRDLHLHFSAARKCDAAVEQANRFIELARERRRDSTFVSSPISESPAASPARVESPRALTPQRVLSADSIDTAVSTATATTTSPRPRPSSSPTNSINPMRSVSSILAPLSRLPSTIQRTRNANVIRAIFPKAINVPEEVLLPMPSKHFVCLTIGSRGDVQPYIALGKALQKEGHRVTIVTHEEYKEWVTGFGVEHRTAGGDPGALMKLSVENKVSSLSIIRYDTR